MKNPDTPYQGDNRGPMWVIIHGNPFCGGMEVLGPFSTDEEAIHFSVNLTDVQDIRELGRWEWDLKDQ